MIRVQILDREVVGGIDVRSSVTEANKAEALAGGTGQLVTTV